MLGGRTTTVVVLYCSQTEQFVGTTCWSGLIKSKVLSAAPFGEAGFQTTIAKTGGKDEYIKCFYVPLQTVLF